eukprot:7612599-Karenia_brevis.AAC.1
MRVKLRKLKANRRWHYVRGPMAAMILTLERIGWKPIAPARWVDSTGAHWQAVREDAMRMIWRKASKHYQGKGLEE